MKHDPKIEIELTKFYNKLVQLEQIYSLRINKQTENKLDNTLNSLVYKLISNSLNLTLNLLTKSFDSAGNDVNAKNIIEILSLLNVSKSDEKLLIKEYDKIKKLNSPEKEEYIFKLIELLQNNYPIYYKLFSIFSYSRTHFVIEISKIRQDFLLQVFNQIYSSLENSNLDNIIQVVNLNNSDFKHVFNENEMAELEYKNITSFSNLTFTYYEDAYQALFLNHLAYLLKDIKINQELNYPYQVLNKFFLFVESLVIYNNLNSLDIVNYTYSKLAYFNSTNLQLADILSNFNSKPYPDNDIKELYKEYFKSKYKVTYKEFKDNLKSNLLYFLNDKPISYLEFIEQNISFLKKYQNINLSTNEILDLYRLSKDFNTLDKDIVNIGTIKPKLKYIIPYILQTIIDIAESYKKDINNKKLKSDINLYIQQFKILLNIELDNSKKI